MLQVRVPAPVCGSPKKAVQRKLVRRITIRVPLLRLYHDVRDLQKGRAIVDHKEYDRGDGERKNRVSGGAELDEVGWHSAGSGHGQGLEKFRKAQRHVKTAKTKFDKYTLDCLEKIDLLAAARCNMFSHALLSYQNAMLTVAKKSNDTWRSPRTTIRCCFSRMNTKMTNPLEKETPKDTKTDDDDQILTDIPADNLLADLSEPAKTEPPPSGSSDLLGLTMDDEFSDFMSSPAPFMPSTLLNNPNPLDGGDDDPLEQLLNLNQPSSSKAPPSGDLFGSFLQSLSKSTDPPKEGKKSGGGGKSKDLSGWYQLFAELDPLSNPDAIPSKADAPHNSLAA
ncbi:hypothetical protein pipiens_016508 [Culex pipiens pipiens]|uniref:AH domain-containing protein n=1 Tax=Culex pipiens pipiens TaxID=38569 RepID=A0ABD1CL38_CULPP